jgi:hypothetical protein
MEPEGSLPRSQEPATCSCPQQDKSSPFLPHPTSVTFILILSSRPRLRLQSGLFPSDFSTKTLYATLIYPISATFPSHLILDWSPILYLVRSAEHEISFAWSDIRRLEPILIESYFSILAVAPKICCLSANLHGVTSMKVATSNLISQCYRLRSEIWTTNFSNTKPEFYALHFDCWQLLICNIVNSRHLLIYVMSCAMYAIWIREEICCVRSREGLYLCVIRSMASECHVV